MIELLVGSTDTNKLGVFCCEGSKVGREVLESEPALIIEDASEHVYWSVGPGRHSAAEDEASVANQHLRNIALHAAPKGRPSRNRPVSVPKQPGRPSYKWGAHHKKLPAVNIRPRRSRFQPGAPVLLMEDPSDQVMVTEDSLNVCKQGDRGVICELLGPPGWCSVQMDGCDGTVQLPLSILEVPSRENTQGDYQPLYQPLSKDVTMLYPTMPREGSEDMTPAHETRADSRTPATGTSELPVVAKEPIASLARRSFHMVRTPKLFAQDKETCPPGLGPSEPNPGTGVEPQPWTADFADFEAHKLTQL